ncbi:MAG: Rne/Rng family ribonuclease [Pseudomonadota bacterium]|nr:Rne/Rng family ribonuclease [Pseudomonadota bacterium]
MAKKMLIDAAHSEEIRVVVADENQRIQEFEVETSGKEMTKGNVYIAEINRVEPSLQAAFVSYGANRNGFLAFGEIHPEYFDLPKAEKKALMEELDEIADKRRQRMEEREQEHERRREEREARKKAKKAAASKANTSIDDDSTDDDDVTDAQPNSAPDTLNLSAEELEEDARALALANAMADDIGDEGKPTAKPKRSPRKAQTRRPRRHSDKKAPSTSEDNDTKKDASSNEEKPKRQTRARKKPVTEATEGTSEEQKKKPTRARKTTTKAKEIVEDESDKTKERTVPIHRRYAIEDVLKEGQKILVQVRKEERGTKGAALTTYISMPGRFTVLMPNTPYAGGISRKINDAEERSSLKKIYDGLKIPKGMGLIMRTAGGGHDEDLIKRDFKNLTSRWKNIQKDFKDKEKQLPALVHEDGSLIVRAVRDMFTDDIEAIHVSGSRAYETTKDYMKFLMPESAKVVKEYKGTTPIFTEHGVEQALNRLHHSKVELPSGGYLIINPTEALISIDVNSGRNTTEKNIEETAYKTNLEAADEVARQLRMRDLAGLVVVDFIDMEDRRNERNVERAMKKAVRKDRARIQVGGISDFGLLEMSRQRLRPSMEESTYESCPHCNGTGVVPTHATGALMLLRNLEDKNVRGKADRIVMTMHTDLAIYILNHKREQIKEMESRLKIQIQLKTDDKYDIPDHRLELIVLSADGKESSQTKEVKLREQAEKGPEARYRGKPNKRKSNKDKRNSKNASDKKPDDKKDVKGKPQKNSDKDSKSSRRTPANKKADSKKPEEKKDQTKDKAEAKSDDKPKRTRKAPAKKAESKEQDKKAEVKSTEAKEAKAEKAPKAEKPKPPAKGIVVETIDAEGNAAVSQNKEKKSVVKSWWSRS